MIIIKSWLSIINKWITNLNFLKTELICYIKVYLGSKKINNFAQMASHAFQNDICLVYNDTL